MYLTVYACNGSWNVHYSILTKGKRIDKVKSIEYYIEAQEVLI